MGRIPVKSLSGIQQGRASYTGSPRMPASAPGTFVNPHVMDAAYPGAENLSAAGDFIFKYQQKMKAAEVNSQIRVSNAQDNSAVSGFLNGLQTRNDYKKFENEFAKFAEKMQMTDEARDSYWPEAAEAIDLNRQVMMENARAKLNGIVNSKRLDKMKSDQLNLIQGAINAGNLEAAQNLYDTGLNDGFFSPEEARRGKAGAVKEIQFAEINKAISGGSIPEMNNYIARLEETDANGHYQDFGALNPNERLSLISHLKNNISTQRKAQETNLSKVLEDPTLKQNDKLRAIMAAEEIGIINKTQGNIFKDKVMYPKGEQKFSAEGWSNVNKALIDYKDEKINRLKFLETLSKSKLPAKDESYFRQRLNELDDPESPENKFEFKTVSKTVRRLTEKWQTAPWWDYDDEEAAQKEMQINTKVKEFIRENPRAKMDEVEAYAKNLFKPESEQMSAAVFRNVYAGKNKLSGALESSYKTAVNPNTGEKLIFKGGKWQKSK